MNVILAGNRHSHESLECSRFGKQDLPVPQRPARVALWLGAALCLAGCAGTPRQPVKPTLVAARTGADIFWLNRVTYGLTAQTLADYRQHGRAAFLDRQLQPTQAPLPPQISAQLDALEITHLDPVATLAHVAAEYKRINGMNDGADKEQARKILNDQGNKLAYEARRRELLRAL